MMLSIFFMYLLAIWLTLKKSPFKSFAHFSIGLFVFLLLSCESSLYIFNTQPLLHTYRFANIFFHSVGCLFHFLGVVLWTPKLLVLLKSNMSIFYLVYYSLGVLLKAIDCPGWCGSVDWALACEPQGHWLIPSQGTCLGCGPGPQLGAYERQQIYVSLTHLFLSLFLSPFPSL